MAPHQSITAKHIQHAKKDALDMQQRGLTSRAIARALDADYPLCFDAVGDQVIARYGRDNHLRTRIL